MKPILTAGIVLGVGSALWSYVYGFAGWYKDPATMRLFWVVILIEIGALVWGLMQTARAGKGYGGQVGAGTMMAIVGAVIIFLNSFLFTVVVFPDSLEVARSIQAEQLALQGQSDENIDQIMEASAFAFTPAFNAIMGAVGTVITGVIISLIAAIFIRSKKPAG